jgi:hypothetical protein
MPTFKTTKDIFTTPWEDELWDDNWMDSNKLVLPPQTPWDYARDMGIADVDIWEVIYQASGGIGVYAAWSPCAEFYLITDRFSTSSNDPHITTYYGAEANKKVIQKMKMMQIPFVVHEHWVEPEMMWLYEKPKPNILILP